jgi:hypothetical protein
VSFRTSLVDILPSGAVTAARTVRWSVAKSRSELLATLPCALDDRAPERAPAFVIGSGRSGTTALGRALGASPELKYFFEPVDRWFAISPATDYGGMFSAKSGRCALGSVDVDDAVRRRFRRVFRSALVDGRQMVEKTPINAFRIGFLDAIDPRTKYIEIRRDGVDVVRSILQLSRKSDYNVLGRGRANRWWGPNDCKWNSLASHVGTLDIEPEYLVPEAEFATRGAIEWIASVKAVERASERLGDRLHRVKYSDLVARPEPTLEQIAAFVGVAPGDWIKRAAEDLRSTNRRIALPLVLPGAIARRMNTWNERLGFSGRALEGPHLSGFTSECQTTSDVD